MTDPRIAKAQEVADRLTHRYGHRAGATGNFDYTPEVTSTGILALDYALGTGGWQDGTFAHVFGPPDIGKSSIIGLNALRQAQMRGKLPGIIALEPGFDPKWAAKNGVDLDMLAIAWPDNGDEAFEILSEWVREGVPDFIVFDSIGALTSEADQEEGAKSRVGGQSKLITEGIKRVAVRAWKNDVTVIFLNQIRDKIGGNIPGLVTPPGGHAIKHLCPVWVQLKPGKDRYTHKIDGEDIVIGREVVAVVTRNKLAEGTGYKARFSHYSKEVEGEPFGVDVAADVINTGTKTGIIRKGGAWLYHDLFPDGKLQGKKAVASFLAEKPEVVTLIRNEIMGVMLKKQAEVKPKPELKVAE